MAKELITAKRLIEECENTKTLIKCENITSGRHLRDILVRLVYTLSKQLDVNIHLLIIRPRLSITFIQSELDSFQGVLLPNIRRRLQVSIQGLGKLPLKPEILMSAATERRIPSPTMSGNKIVMLPQPDKQSEIFRVLLRQWFLGQDPVTSTWLENEAIHCNYRTVAATIDHLKPAIQRYTDRRIKLKYFPMDAWRKFLVIAPKARATKLYVDRSGQPRSIESLVRRLVSLDRADIAIAGDLGAKRYYPDLDIAGTPRLDLCIHAYHPTVDLSFIDKLDPALEQCDDPLEPIRLALHFVRRKTPFFDTDGEHTWADPVECLADLSEMRLDIQASSFLDFLSNRAEDFNGGN